MAADPRSPSLDAADVLSELSQYISLSSDDHPHLIAANLREFADRLDRPREPSMEDRAAYFAEVEARHDGRDLGSAAGIGPEPNSLDNREAQEEQEER